MIKKASAKLDSVCDVERALSESKDSASAVSIPALPFVSIITVLQVSLSIIKLVLKMVH